MELNKELHDVTAKYIGIGTKEIKKWCGGKPFIIPLDTKEDFEENGFDFPDKEMKIGELVESKDFDGVYIMRIS